MSQACFNNIAIHENTDPVEKEEAFYVLSGWIQRSALMKQKGHLINITFFPQYETTIACEAARCFEKRTCALKRQTQISKTMKQALPVTQHHPLFSTKDNAAWCLMMMDPSMNTEIIHNIIEQSLFKTANRTVRELASDEIWAAHINWTNESEIGFAASVPRLAMETLFYPDIFGIHDLGFHDQDYFDELDEDDFEDEDGDQANG
jgi:hypothetical protein